MKDKHVAFAAGITLGLHTLVLTLISIHTGLASDYLRLLVDMYPGFSISYIGAVVGFIYSFLTGFILLLIFESVKKILKSYCP